MVTPATGGKRSFATSLIDLRDEGPYTWITADKPNSMQIIRRLVNKGWCFIHLQRSDQIFLVIPNAIDVDKDIRARIKDIVFSVEE